MWSPKEDKTVLRSCMVIILKEMQFFQFCLTDFGMLVSLEHSVFEEKLDIENKVTP